MNEEAFNVSIRKFLKKVGITSQREIEQAVRSAVSGGRLKGNEALPAKVTLSVEGVASVELLEPELERVESAAQPRVDRPARQVPAAFAISPGVYPSRWPQHDHRPVLRL